MLDYAYCFMAFQEEEDEKMIKLFKIPFMNKSVYYDEGQCILEAPNKKKIIKSIKKLTIICSPVSMADSHKRR